MVGRQKCLPQDLLKLGFRRVACIDAGRAAYHTIAQHGCADFSDAETVIASIPGHRRRSLGVGAARATQAWDEHALCACDSGQHDGASVECESTHRVFLRVGRSVASSFRTGRLTVSSAHNELQAALAGRGIAHVFDGYAKSHVQSGLLVELLSDWSPTLPHWFLYYPSRRLPSAAMRAFLDYMKSYDWTAND